MKMQMARQVRPSAKRARTVVAAVVASRPAGGVMPQVSWWCLLRKAGRCVGRCGTNFSCYATCAPEALSCF
jgi:hypothetical protein